MNDKKSIIALIISLFLLPLSCDRRHETLPQEPEIKPPLGNPEKTTESENPDPNEASNDPQTPEQEDDKENQARLSLTFTSQDPCLNDVAIDPQPLGYQLLFSDEFGSGIDGVSCDIEAAFTLPAGYKISGAMAYSLSLDYTKGQAVQEYAEVTLDVFGTGLQDFFELKNAEAPGPIDFSNENHTIAIDACETEKSGFMTFYALGSIYPLANDTENQGYINGKQLEITVPEVVACD